MRPMLDFGYDEKIIDSTNTYACHRTENYGYGDGHGNRHEGCAYIFDEITNFRGTTTDLSYGMCKASGNGSMTYNIFTWNRGNAS